MFLEDFMQCFCIISHQSSSLERMFRDIQIVIITKFVVVSSVDIKRIDCISICLLLNFLSRVLNVKPQMFEKKTNKKTKKKQQLNLNGYT